MMDITIARLQHIHWTEQVINALKKGQFPETSNHKQCDLGKWLQSADAESTIPKAELKKLKQKHQKFHESVTEMLQYLNTKDYDNAEILLGEFRRGSKDVVFLLSMLEYHLYDKQKF